MKTNKQSQAGPNPHLVGVVPGKQPLERLRVPPRRSPNHERKPHEDAKKRRHAERDRRRTPPAGHPNTKDDNGGRRDELGEHAGDDTSADRAASSTYRCRAAPE